MLAVAARGETECYCDGWYSTNTRTLEYPMTFAQASAGMSYRGAKSTTVNGMECMPWADVFEACTAGFEDANEDALYAYQVESAGPVATFQNGIEKGQEWIISSWLAHMSPDLMGLRDIVRPLGLFEEYDPTFNHCRMPALREAWEHSEPGHFHFGGKRGAGVGFMPAGVTAAGPFCFVDASDPDAAVYTPANGWSWGETLLGALCPHVTPVPCGISRCEPDAAPGSAVNCARSAAENGGAASAQLLMANGGMELWEMRSNKNGVMRTVQTENVNYRKFPPYPEGANPSEPRFWDLCLYTPETLEDMDIGYNATTDALSGVLHKVGALTLCDPVDPRGQGITLSQVSSGRDDGETGPSSAARMGFVKVNDTASLKAENGAMASMVPGAVHIARAWVRCAKGSSTVALVVSKLPHDAPVVAQDIPVSMTYHDAMTNLSVAGASTTNTHRCDVDASAYTSSSDAPESLSGWVQLEVAVSSTQAEHDITMQVIVQSHSSDAAVVIDDASWEVKTGTSPTLGTGSDGSIAEWVFSTTCAGGGGGGVSYTDAHKCSSDPTRLFYRLREMGGVPVAHETVHAMVLIGYQSVRCRRPELDAVSQAECPFLSEAILPHLSADDVRAYMDTLSDYELAQAMRWDDERVRAPGVRSNLAISMLRAGLPEAIELGVVRVADGPKYNVDLSSGDNPNFGPSPTAGIVWHAMSSTSEMKVFDDLTHAWRQCSHHEDLRHALCYFWADVRFSFGCSMISSLVNVAGWEEYVTFEGWVGTLEVVNNHYETFLEPLVKHFLNANIAGEAVCYRSLLDVYENLARAPSSLALEESIQLTCAAPLTRAETTALLSLVLPMAPPDGMTCVDLTTVDFTTTNPFVHHEHLHASDGTAGDDAARRELILAIALSVGAVGVLALGLAAARFFPRRDAGMPAEHDASMSFSSLNAISPRILTSCARSSTLLGKGADAEVFSATVMLPDGEKKHIATKMFYKASSAKAEISFYERLPRHENILSVYGCYFDNDAQRWCVALELLRLGNVRESMLTKAFPRHAPFVHRTLSGVIDALGALHADGMAHRDLKLDNVLLSCECAQEAECACLRTCSPSLRGRLADFAMARQGALMGVSSANLKGTMMYVPPERVEYDPADHESDFYLRGDVYALGLLTWEVLHYLHSGEVVSCAEAILPGVRSPQDVLIRISSGKFVPPCEFLPESVRRYLHKCWHFQPSKRFKDAREARRVWEKIRADVQAVADQSQILQRSIGSSTKGSDAALLGSTVSSNRDRLTGVTTTTASPPRSSV